MAAIPLLGSVGILNAGAGTFALMAGNTFWYIQNQDISPLRIEFLGTRTGIFTSLNLTPAPARGAAGGYLDSIGFGYYDTLGFTITSDIGNAAFGSGQSKYQPVNSYPYPGSPIPQAGS